MEEEKMRSVARTLPTRGSGMARHTPMREFNRLDRQPRPALHERSSRETTRHTTGKNVAKRLRRRDCTGAMVTRSDRPAEESTRSDWTVGKETDKKAHTKKRTCTEEQA